MKVAVIGAGVVGVACAYFLGKEGYDVVVLDQHDKAAEETSYGNAGLYSPSDSFAWASPAALKTAIKSLCRKDLGIQYNLRMDPALWFWSLKFLGQCTSAAAVKNTRAKFRLASYSIEKLDDVVVDTSIDFGLSKNGIMFACRTGQTLTATWEHMSLLKDLGLPLELFGKDEIVEKVPNLEHCPDLYTGGVYSPRCYTGSSHQFANELLKWCEDNQQCSIQWGTRVSGFETSKNRITSVKTPNGSVEADAFVLAAGVGSEYLGATLGVKPAIYPVKGFSITAKILDRAALPDLGFVDEDRLIAMSCFGDYLRIASSAVFSGHDKSYQSKDFDSILSFANELFPNAADFEGAERWAGFRPMRPNSVPALGPTRISNLFMNTGHGHLGWTLSCGSGKVISDCVAGRSPEIDLDGLTL